MADIHDHAVIATVGIAIDQQVTATLGPHVAQSDGFELSNFDRRLASQLAPPSAFRQEPAARGQDGEPAHELVADLGEGLPPAIALRNDRALIGAPGIGNGLAIQRLNLAVVSAMTIPQRRLSNGPGRIE